MMDPSDKSMSPSQVLPMGIYLNRKYTIGNILGSGGFGITYGGVEAETGVPVAIKEYFPHRLVLRTQEQGKLSVALFSEKYRQEFEEGRRHFIDEAKILRELEYLDNIVSVLDYFEENGTAYIVMKYIEGVTLGEFVKENGRLSFSEMKVMFSPLLLSIWEMHQRGLIHRDISPENLILGTDSRLHLIDFGAAKLNPREGDVNTVILKAGYAPVELYVPNGKIGPWTDIYSLCATMYFVLTGASPTEAIQRMEQKDDETLTGLEKLLPEQAAVLKKGLALRAANRFADVMKLWEALQSPSGPEQEETVMGAAFSGERAKKIRKINRRQRKGYRILLSALALVLLLLVLWKFGGSLLSGSMRQETSVSNLADIPPSSDEKLFQTPAATEEQHSSTVSGGQPSSAGSGEQPSPTGSGEQPSPTGSEGQPSQTVSESQPSMAVSQMPVESVLLSMISLKNMKLKKAKKVLKELDPSIKISTEYVYHQKIAAGCIVQQSVASGTLFTRGNLSSILLTVSRGKEKHITSAPAEKTPVPTAARKGKKPSDFQVKPEDEYTDFSLE